MSSDTGVDAEETNRAVQWNDASNTRLGGEGNRSCEITDETALRIVLQKNDGSLSS
jgi:hypothetical protein